MSLREKLQPEVLKELAAKLGVKIQKGRWLSYTYNNKQHTCNMCPITTYLRGNGHEFEPCSDTDEEHDETVAKAAEVLGVDYAEVADFIAGFDSASWAPARESDEFRLGRELQKVLDVR